jgi:hypothetical protein
VPKVDANKTSSTRGIGSDLPVILDLLVAIPLVEIQDDQFI